VRPKRRSKRSLVVKAAVAWFRSRRPELWLEKEHLERPTVYHDKAEDKRLAKAVARLLKAEKEKKAKQKIEAAVDGKSNLSP